MIRIRKNGLSKKVIDFAAISASAAPAGAQTGTAEQRAPTHPLGLAGAILLANAQGRIEHLGVGSKGCLFVSALGNHSEEAIDLGAGRVTLSVAVPAHADQGAEVLIAAVQALNTNSYRHSSRG